VNLKNFTPSMLMTTRYVMDALFPLVVLIIISLLTRPTEKTRLERFYVRLKTPVAPTLEADALAVRASYENPARYDHLKLFPRTNWEFTKWNRQDLLGFLACCAMVGVVLIVFKLVLTIGA